MFIVRATVSHIIQSAPTAVVLRLENGLDVAYLSKRVRRSASAVASCCCGTKESAPAALTFAWLMRRTAATDKSLNNIPFSKGAYSFIIIIYCAPDFLRVHLYFQYFEYSMVIPMVEIHGLTMTHSVPL
jgi:hypothetical protein